MVKSGVEDGFIFLVGSCNVNFRQILIPRLTCVFAYLIEIPSGNFRFDILACACYICLLYTSYNLGAMYSNSLQIIDGVDPGQYCDYAVADYGGAASPGTGMTLKQCGDV